MVAGNTVRDAARLASVPERTATRWLADPELRRAIAEERTARLGAIADRLSHLSVRGLDELEAILTTGCSLPACAYERSPSCSP
jgi:hypothetical protein